MRNSHVGQTLPAPLIEFPHYCIIALTMAPGYVGLCEYANPHDSTPQRVSTCLSSLDIIVGVNSSGFSG